MYKTPTQIGRSLRALQNGRGLVLLDFVRILPGADSCEEARSQCGANYSGDAVPRLPLVQRLRNSFQCTYVPVGAERFRQLYTFGKTSPDFGLHVPWRRS